ncbi:MAG: capsule assembly Wzi family protein [Daejeonella sp.]
MKQIVIVLKSFFLCMILSCQLKAQSLPVGTPVLADYYRQKQLLGELDSTISFTIRPLFPSASFGLQDVFDPDTSLEKSSGLRFKGRYQSSDGQLALQLLPVSWQQQYNDVSPYGWNDGAMIPSRGYQTILSGGFFAKLGPLSIQLQPEYVFAQNQDYEVLDIYGGTPDLPVRFGNGVYSKATWGQSSIRLNFGAMSLGLSNENLWWGPGRQNSLLMSNNSQGFKHLTLNTIRPLRTPVGSLELQVLAGKLEGSDYNSLNDDPKYSDWRYLSAFAISYQPKWVPGLFLGLNRVFQAYRKDIKKIGDYIPLFTPFQKVNRNVFEEPFGRDQLTSVFARWIFTKAHAEVYVEYGANDNAYNTRDFIGSPEHSRAYIFGLSKLTGLPHREGEYIRLNAEITQMSQSIDRLVRNSGSWYEHSQVLQGYTHKGEVLGAGIGPGGNLQTLDLSWVKGIKSVGIQFDRYVHDDDYYYAVINDVDGMSRKWVDLTITGHGTWNYKNFLFNTRLKLINSLNYQWRYGNFDPNSYYIPENHVFNFHGELGLTYRF